MLKSHTNYDMKRADVRRFSLFFPAKESREMGEVCLCVCVPVGGRGCQFGHKDSTKGLEFSHEVT